MHSLPKPNVIITHESDLDGLVAGVLLQRLAKKLFDTWVPLEAYHYQGWKQREPREATGWVTDLSFEPRIDKVGWVIIDHHTTDATPKNAQLILDTTKSAGMICYELCKENGLESPELDRLVHLVVARGFGKRERLHGPVGSGAKMGERFHIATAANDRERLLPFLLKLRHHFFEIGVHRRVRSSRRAGSALRSRICRVSCARGVGIFCGTQSRGRDG